MLQLRFELTSVIAINVLEERRLHGIAARGKVFAGSRKMHQVTKDSTTK